MKETTNSLSPFMLCRFVVVCGDGEYIIYTAMALRNKSFGSAQEFVWSNDSSVYAIREGSSTVKIFKNFKEQKSFKPDFGAEGSDVHDKNNIFDLYLMSMVSSKYCTQSDMICIKALSTAFWICRYMCT